jgi:arylsulfatase A-like enzyme
VIGKWHLGLGNHEKPVDWNLPIHPSPLDVGFNTSYIMAATNDRVPCVYVDGRVVENLDPDDPIEVSYSKENPFPEIPTGKRNPELLTTFHSDAQHFDTIVNGVGRIGFSRGGKRALWDDQTMSDVFLNKSKEFIEENKETPFFLYYALHQPHVPRIPSKRFEGATNKGPRGDVIAELDWCVGEILDHLKKHELNKNTLVVFSSDNGPVLDDGYEDMSVEKCGAHKPAGPLRGGKYSMFDGGSRVPMITYCPGLVKEGKNKALFSHVDFLASLSSLCEYPTDTFQELDSIDLMNVILGKSEDGRDHLVTEGIGAKTVIRWKNWIYIPPYNGPKIFADKNIETGNDNVDQLYNLENDIGQITNIAGEHPEILEKLKNLLQSVQKDSPPQNNNSSNVSDI